MVILSCTVLKSPYCVVFFLVLKASFHKIDIIFQTYQCFNCESYQTHTELNVSVSSIVRRAVCSCVAVRPRDCYLGNRLQLQRNPSRVVYLSYSLSNKDFL